MFSIWIGQPHLHTNLPVARWALSFVFLTWQFRRKDCAPMSSYARAYAHSHTYARAIAQTTKRPLEPRGDWRELHPRSRTRWSLRPEKEQTAIRYKVITVHILSQRSQTRRRTHTHTHTHTHTLPEKKKKDLRKDSQVRDGRGRTPFAAVVHEVGLEACHCRRQRSNRKR